MAAKIAVLSPEVLAANTTSGLNSFSNLRSEQMALRVNFERMGYMECRPITGGTEA